MNYIVANATQLCSPVLVPQIWGGEFPPGLVTVNLSVRHWDASATLLAVAARLETPFRILLLDRDSVVGPVITKVVKSRRSFKANM